MGVDNPSFVNCLEEVKKMCVDKKYIYILAIALFALFFQPAAVEAAELIEEDIDEFTFLTMESGDPHIGEIINSHTAKYSIKENICEVIVYDYLTEEQLLDTALDEFDLIEDGDSSQDVEEKLSLIEGYSIFKIENVFLWNNKNQIVITQPEYDWIKRNYKDYSCDGLLSTYLQLYIPESEKLIDSVQKSQTEPLPEEAQEGDDNVAGSDEDRFLVVVSEADKNREYPADEEGEEIIIPQTPDTPESIIESNIENKKETEDSQEENVLDTPIIQSAVLDTINSQKEDEVSQSEQELESVFTTSENQAQAQEPETTKEKNTESEEKEEFFLTRIVRIFKGIFYS